MYFVSKYSQNLEVLNELFAHRIFPRRMWPISDVMMEIGLLMPISIYGCLLLDPGLGDKFKMYLFVDAKTGNAELVQNSRLLGAAEATSIYQYRKWMRKFIKMTILSLFFIITLFFSGHFALSWNAKTGLFQIVIKLFEFITFCLYFPVTNVYIIFYFLLNVRYIRLKQKALEMRILRFEIVVKQNSKKLKNQVNLQTRFLATFKSLNLEAAQLYEKIEKGHARFWNKYLTIFFAIYVLEICFFSHALLFATHSDAFVDRFFLAFFISFFIFILNYVTLECSRMVAHNFRSYRTMQRLSLIILQNSKHDHLLNASELLKFDQLAESSETVTRVTFVLMANYRINSEMFLSVKSNFFVCQI